MATKTPKMKERQSKMRFLSPLKLLFFHSEFSPLVFSFLLLGLSYVVIRMKNVEQDYALHDLQKKVRLVTKDLTALETQHAELLSVQNLRRWSKENQLIIPGPERMIIIPANIRQKQISSKD